MPASDQMPSALATLSAKEVEVLRLLAAGHTVKSIAVRLERSEASINERLRDARRKTGVGSSRELARLLDAQEIWDKKIELSGNAVNSDPSPQLPTGRQTTKGTATMLIALPILAVGLALAADPPQSPPEPLPAKAAVAPALPLAGRWALDLERIPASERPLGVTIAFTRSDDGRWTTEVDIAQPDGARQHAASTAATDGTPVGITGNMSFIDSVALRQPAADTLVMTLGKKGAPVSTRVYTVSKDRRSMTETIIWASGELPKLETTYFHRVG